MTDLEWIGASAAVLGGCFALKSRGGKSNAPATPRTLLDRRLKWGGGLLDYRDVCKSVLITGETGSGKTSAMAALVKEVAQDGCGLLITGAKPSDCQTYLKILRAAGRSDVVVISAGGGARVSLFDELLGDGDCPTEAIKLQAAFSGICEALSRRKQSGGEGEGKFFREGGDRMARLAIELLLAAGEGVTVPRMLDVIRTAPNSPRQAHSPEWRKSYCSALLERALAHATPETGADVRELLSYWTAEYPNIAERTRSCFQAEVQNPADLLSRGVAARLLGGEATVSIKDCVARNTIILTDFSVGLDGEIAVVVNTATKLLVQKALLARAAAADQLPYFLCMDEYPVIYTSSDAAYLATQRSSRGPQIMACQGVEQFREGTNNDSTADIVSGNCIQVAAGPQTPATVKFYVEKIGDALQVAGGGSVSSKPYDSPADLLGGGTAQATGSFSQSRMSVLTPAWFANQRFGGPENGLEVDCTVFSPSLVRRVGSPFAQVSIKQGEK